MRKIAITVPELFAGEGEAITSLLRDGGYWRVHIRKPGATADDVASLIAEIPPELYPRLTLHDHFDVAVRMGLGGVHLNMRNPEATAGWTGMVSRSLHSVDDLQRYAYDYAFLSPIYPSISKPGYKGDFDFRELKAHVTERVFALGGVTPDKFSEIESLGFGGVAMLGEVWKARIDPEKFRLQYITHPVEGTTIAEMAEKVLAGGCRWIQLRHKDAEPATLIAEGRALRALCDRYGATFIIDDHVELVEATGADGVHLGKNDMPPAQAREILGVRKIIGATANSYDDIARATAAGADYMGVGPYHFTTTKEKLSPVLGLRGYEEILTQCRENGIRLPIVAIGGIELPDIAPVMLTGVDGVAVSGAIRNAVDPAVATADIIEKIELTNKMR